MTDIMDERDLRKEKLKKLEEIIWTTQNN
jgi:hypothetical protein